MATGFTDMKSRKSEEQGRDRQIHEALCESGWGRFLIIHGNLISEHIVEFEDTLAANIISIKRRLSVNRKDFAHRQKLKVSDLDVWMRSGLSIDRMPTLEQHQFVLALALALMPQIGSNFTCCWL